MLSGEKRMALAITGTQSSPKDLSSLANKAMESRTLCRLRCSQYQNNSCKDQGWIYCEWCQKVDYQWYVQGAFAISNISLKLVIMMTRSICRLFCNSSAYRERHIHVADSSMRWCRDKANQNILFS